MERNDILQQAKRRVIYNPGMEELARELSRAQRWSWLSWAFYMNLKDLAQVFGSEFGLFAESEGNWPNSFCDSVSDLELQEGVENR